MTVKSKKRAPKIVVVMPAYNAGRTLRMTYEELHKDTLYLVILLDDGSTDMTLEVARQLGLEIFVHNRNYGYGANQKTCYTEALRAGADVVVMVHPDYQYDPTLVPQIVEPIVHGDADVVLGSRLKGSPALAPVRQPPRPLHAPRLKGLARALDGGALVLAALAVAVLAAGRLRLAGMTLERAEDLVVVLALVVGARLALAPVTLPRVSPRALVAGGVAVYVLVMGVVVVTRHVALRTHALDLGYYVQVVWSLAHGHGARVTLPPMHAWGDHFSPILYLFVPLGWLAPGAIALLLAQTAIFAAGAVVMAGFATRRLGDARAAAGFAVLYLLNPTLHGINVRYVHTTAFAIPQVIAAARAVAAGRPAGVAGGV